MTSRKSRERTWQKGCVEMSVNELTINMGDYLSEDKIKDICEEELRYAVRRHLNNEQNMKRYMSNLSYEYIFDCLVNTVDGLPTRDYLKQKVEEIIRDPSTLRYEVFRDSKYGDTESPARRILNQVLSETKPIIEEEVKKRIAEYDFVELREDIEDVVYECVIRMIRGTEKSGSRND